MKKSLVLAVVMIFTVSMISGCETTPKKVKEDMTDLKTRVGTLETRVDTIESKQTEPTGVSSSQSGEETVLMEGTNISVSRTKGTRMKNIQRALQNAGYYDGSIDGVKGPKTRSAIKAFQKANGLAADGVVGDKTWAALSKYLSGGEGAK